MTISTITISGNDYTAYASVAEADVYLAVDPVRSAAWAAKTTDQKGGLLVAATRRLDTLSYAGTPTGGSAQTTAWPRTGLTYSDGTAVSTTEVPQSIEDACILLAGTMASTPAAANVGTSANNKKRLKAGSAEIEYFRPTDGVPLQDETAYVLIKQWLAGVYVTEGISTGALASGTCEESEFTDKNMGFTLSSGYP